MSEDGFDYSNLAREAEQKKVKPDRYSPTTGPMGKTRSETLKSEAQDPSKYKGDRQDISPAGGSVVLRKRDGRPTGIPTTQQHTLDAALELQERKDESSFSIPVDTVQTRKGMKPLQPIDRALQEAKDNQQTPSTLRKAHEQMLAKTRNILDRAQKSTKK